MTSDLVKKEVSRQLNRLQSLPEHPQKAELAHLRRGVGRKPGELPELWGSFLLGMPESLQSNTGEPTPAEWAIYLSLTLFALHQQGHPLPQDTMHRPGQPLGAAIGTLVSGEELENSSILRRFNQLATADSMPEIAHYLRTIVQMLRSNGIPLDYVRLASDLYYLQFQDHAFKIRLKWGQDFYRKINKSSAEPKEEEAANE